jgi:predicted O-linked N-acetylglucosamine transferase (SPINDLY family)
VAGIEPQRLDLAGRVSHEQLLATYADIDIALDPFPYSGGLTTCEALWMGVPVITLTGNTFAGRHSTSHLSNVGLPELTTKTPEAYVATALALAHDPARLATLRQGLRAQMAASPLCDAKRYTRDLEAAYRQMWIKYCENPDTRSERQDPS